LAALVDGSGKRFELGEVFRLGRLRHSDYVLESGRVARLHASLTRLLSGRYEAEDMQSTNGTRLNGVALTWAVLAHRDVLEIDGREFTFEQPEVPEARVDEALLAVARGGESALEVWLDAQVEQGAKHAAALSGAAPPDLSPEVQDAVKQASLFLEWKRGLIRGAQVRGSSMHTVRALLTQLLASPAALFLERLQLPMFSERLGLHDVPLTALRRLTIGPHFIDEDVAATRAALNGMRFPFAPLLEPIVVQSFGEAWLQFADDSTRALRRGRVEHVSGCEVRWGPGWVIGADRPFRVNGRKVSWARLAPGDELSVADQRFVFRAKGD
jgi:hypothetical protein